MYTEAQMREFFQGLIDQVASLSTQANRVSGLEAQIADLTTRVSNVEAENDNLRRQLGEANDRSAQARYSLEQSQYQLDAERAASQGLRDTIVQRDETVVRLQRESSDWQSQHNSAVRERDEARNTVNDLNVLVDELRRKLTAAQEGETHWHSEANRLEDEVASMQAQFERLRGILTPVVPSADVAAS